MPEVYRESCMLQKLSTIQLSKIIGGFKGLLLGTTESLRAISGSHRGSTFSDALEYLSCIMNRLAPNMPA